MFEEYVLDVLSFWDEEWTEGVPAFCPISEEGDVIIVGLTCIGFCPGKLVGVIHKDGQEAVDKWIKEHPNWQDDIEKYVTSHTGEQMNGNY